MSSKMTVECEVWESGAWILWGGDTSTKCWSLQNSMGKYCGLVRLSLYSEHNADKNNKVRKESEYVWCFDKQTLLNKISTSLRSLKFVSRQFQAINLELRTLAMMMEMREVGAFRIYLWAKLIEDCWSKLLSGSSQGEYLATLERHQRAARKYM